MGFFDTLGSMFGVTQGSQGSSSAGAGEAQAQQAGENANTAQGNAQNFANQSYGANAADTMQKAQAAAQGVSKEAAENAGNVAGRSTLTAARSAGLNKGQASLEGGQAGSTAAQQTYGQMLPSMMGQYQNAAGTQAGLAQAYNQNEINAGNVQATAGVNQQGQSQKGGGALLGLAGQIIKSDKDAKKFYRMRGSPLEELLKNVDPKVFSYKDDSSKEKHLGVTAQDVEKTPLAGAVKDTPEGKMLDTGQLAGGNLALIVELGHRLMQLEERGKAHA